MPDIRNDDNGNSELAFGYEPLALIRRASSRIVGLEAEIELVAVALSTRRNIVLEGPPGTGKSTLLREMAAAAGSELHFVEGNAELTPARLIGYFDPAVVIVKGYQSDAFMPGPLTRAMAEGGIFYLEEFNRAPEEAINALVTALADGEIQIPRFGTVKALPGFRFVAAMNPFDSVGTNRIGQAIYDRLCRVHIDYQSRDHEMEIVRTNLRQEAKKSTGLAPGATASDVAIAVDVVRVTRKHPDLRSGSSVRGAIDFALLAAGLRGVRKTSSAQPTEQLTESDAVRTYVDSALTSLSARVKVDELTDRTVANILTEIVEQVVAARPTADSVEEPEPVSASALQSLSESVAGGPSGQATNPENGPNSEAGAGTEDGDLGESDDNAVQGDRGDEPGKAPAPTA